MTAKSYTEEEIREIAERQNLVGYPHLALMREKLSVKAKNEPKFRFYNLKRLVVETETLKCAWAQVRANKGAPGVDGVTIEDIEQSEGGAESMAGQRGAACLESCIGNLGGLRRESVRRSRTNP